MIVLVTGIRGSIARRVADCLHASGEDVRATSKAAAGERTGYPVVTVDLTDPTALPGALVGVDRVLLYAAADAIDDVARMLGDAGVEQVVLISSASVPDTRLAAIAGHHRVVEDAVRALDVRWTFLRPGIFARNTLAWTAGVRAGRVSLPYPDAFVEPIHEADIADAAVAALTSTALDGVAPLMSGPQSLTQRQQVETIAAALGTPIEVETMAPGEWRAQMSNWMPGEAADALLDGWARSSSPAPVEHTVHELTGAEPRSYGRWVADNLAAFGDQQTK